MVQMPQFHAHNHFDVDDYLDVIDYLGVIHFDGFQISLANLTIVSRDLKILDEGLYVPHITKTFCFYQKNYFATIKSLVGCKVIYM